MKFKNEHILVLFMWKNSCTLANGLYPSPKILHSPPPLPQKEKKFRDVSNSMAPVPSM